MSLPIFPAQGMRLNASMRSLRPGELWDVTVRCNRAEFRFLPTKERRETIGFWLAKAQTRFPGILIFAVVQMSNHLHLILQDRDSELSSFMQYFLSHTAKSINGLDRTSGALFGRRFAAIPIIDSISLVHRIAYAITNPVSARLVRSHHAWTGLCRWSRGCQPSTETFTFFHYGRYQTARRSSRTGVAVRRDNFVESASLVLSRLEGATDAEIEKAIREREGSLSKTAALGMRKVLKSKPCDRPKTSKRSPMPVCLLSVPHGDLVDRRLPTTDVHLRVVANGLFRLL